MPTRACARNIELLYGPIGSAHETVIRIVCVKVRSRDDARRIDAGGEGSLTGARTCVWSVEGGYGAIGSADETARNRARANVHSRDMSCRVDADTEGSLKRTGACARNIEVGVGLSLRRWGRNDR
jgi:hypothetical protein